MTEAELAVLRSSPGLLASKLGLPPGMHAKEFDIFQITPRTGALVFESKVAQTAVNGVVNTIGGATQTIVPNRSLFTPPVKIGTIRAQ